MGTINENPAGSGEYTFGPDSPGVEGDQWCTAEQVAEITGATVTPDLRTRAALTIGTMVGLIEGVQRPDISDRDKHYLKLATAYQAAWMKNHPDLFDREDVTSAGQDGESVSFRNVDSHVLAPLARKAIRRLSWRGKRMVMPGGGSATASTSRLNVNSEDFDDSLPWTPL